MNPIADILARLEREKENRMDLHPVQGYLAEINMLRREKEEQRIFIATLERERDALLARKWPDDLESGFLYAMELAITSGASQEVIHEMTTKWIDESIRPVDAECFHCGMMRPHIADLERERSELAKLVRRIAAIEQPDDLTIEDVQMARALLAEQNGAKGDNAIGGEPSVRELYDELLYAVARKYPDETRHETALRYIRQREQAVQAGERDCAKD